MYRIVLFIFILSTSSPVFAQQALPFDTNSKLFVDGTSTIHDWTVETVTLKGTIEISKNSPVTIPAVAFEIPVSSLQSGKSGMDSRMYEALKSKKHPVIQFQAENVSVDASGTGVAEGNVTIAGVQKTISVPFTATESGGTWTFSGSVPLLMTDFSIDPPVALMGTIKTGNEITIRFELTTSGK